MPKNALANYGYPSAKALRNQAGVIADASVPTVAATTKPYNQQHQGVAGFLAAVLDALGSSKGEVASDYSDAQGQQAAIDQAAASRLASLGLGSYAPGVIATQGARGDSASANLISQGAAARNYIAKQPGIATGFAQTQNSAINKALSEALTQRMTARSSAYGTALQQVQQNAMQRADFLAGRVDARNSLAMQRAQMAQSQAQFDANLSFQQQQADRDAYYHSPDYLRKAHQIEAAGTDLKKNGYGGLTPNEVAGQMKDANSLIGPQKASTSKIPKYNSDGKVIGYTIKPDAGGGDNRDFLTRGVGFQAGIDRLVAQGINRRVATISLARYYQANGFDAKATGGRNERNAFHSFVSYLQWLRDHHFDQSTPIHDMPGQ